MFYRLTHVQQPERNRRRARVTESEERKQRAESMTDACEILSQSKLWNASATLTRQRGKCLQFVAWSTDNS